MSLADRHGDRLLRRLLPELDAEGAQRARRAATLLRLVDVEARSRSPHTVGLSLDRALAELEHDRRAATGRALASLCIHHLEAAIGAESFLSLPTPELPSAEAWRELVESDAGSGERAAPPDPGESPLSVAERSLRALARLSGRSELVRRLEPALARAAEGPRVAEHRFRRLARHAPLRLAARVGRIECLLDVGAVARARALALRPLPTSARDRQLVARARELSLWTELLTGGTPSAPVEAAGPLPQSMLELARRRPDWAALLSTQRRPRRRRATASTPGLRWEDLRAELGASVAAGFLHDGAGRPFPFEVECAPELDPERVRFAAEPRPGLARLAEGAVRVVHDTGRGFPESLRASLGRLLSPRTVALVVARAGPGWIWLELEHHLVPSASRLERVAEAFRQRCTARADWAGDRRPGSVVGNGGWRPGRDLRWRSEALRSLARGLLAEGPGRAWWGFAADGGGLRLAAGGGPALAERNRASALRAARAREPICLGPEGPSGREATRGPEGPRARFVLPLVSHGSRIGALVFDSERERDFGEAFRARACAQARDGADQVRLAGARDWFRASEGREVFLELGSEDGRRTFEEVLAAAAAREPVAVIGPPGSGKGVVARWVLRERARSVGRPTDVARLELEAGSSAAVLASALSAGGPVAVEELQRLGPKELVRLASGAAARVEGLVATWSAASVEELSRLGALRDPASRRVVSRVVRVAPLAERREQVPALAERLLADALEGLGAPLGLALELDEPARAWLWRQPWPGNVRQLARLARAVAERLAARACAEAGAGVHEGAPGRHSGWSPWSPGLADLRRAARALACSDLERLPPAATPEAVVRAALRSCRGGRGGAARRRAAGLLGWHPSTLARRLARGSGGSPARESRAGS